MRPAAAFGDIYRKNLWSSRFKSGEGAAPHRNRGYVRFLEGFLRERGVRNVVEIGCGDWSFSKDIDWQGASYLGIDIVPELIESNNRTHRRDGVRFVCDDALAIDVPEADLMISKDVLHHWPNDAIAGLLSKIKRFRYALLTNDRFVVRLGPWNRLFIPGHMGPLNGDVEAGGWRPLDLRKAPFFLDAAPVFTICNWIIDRLEVKHVLLWKNPHWAYP